MCNGINIELAILQRAAIRAVSAVATIVDHGCRNFSGEQFKGLPASQSCSASPSSRSRGHGHSRMCPLADRGDREAAPSLSSKT